MGEAVCVCWGEAPETNIVGLKYSLDSVESIFVIVVELWYVFLCKRIMWRRCSMCPINTPMMIRYSWNFVPF